MSTLNSLIKQLMRHDELEFNLLLKIDGLFDVSEKLDTKKLIPISDNSQTEPDPYLTRLVSMIPKPKNLEYGTRTISAVFGVYTNEEIGAISLCNYSPIKLIPINDNPPVNSENLLIHSMILTKQNQGYGTRILSIIAKQAKELNYETLSLGELKDNNNGLTLNDQLAIFEKIGRKIGLKTKRLAKDNDNFLLYQL